MNESIIIQKLISLKRVANATINAVIGNRECKVNKFQRLRLRQYSEKATKDSIAVIVVITATSINGEKRTGFEVIGT